ncbi:hypothetical protein TVAG_273990 [Trichomonas vaginalis G3]|uniref:Uncharacterized protein n=1 Tax=Trichomonas vaginalis (strain ATCC PRA-98 / G3) TaxID=412133 RepID=A2FSN0_TRIV3|nr:ankyrin repeat protein family [Trichomonas vaginalis G3]EAX92086.1 hypothetical protein TVAG_273990 [Trichomonas vaginalis G3]KAI5550593.1 ankyrin repeat protein family [Trichomonas vaginalis G3]|eukprot:XP_001305016.1 hypothetical protein [Trichomonas vaginalis G3]
MSKGIQLNFEYIGSHLEDYIDDNKLFTTFEIDDINQIMSFANLSTNDFINILKQAHSTVNANKLYFSTRNANIITRNLGEVITLLKSVREFMKLKILDGAIDLLIQLGKRLPSSEEQLPNSKPKSIKENNETEILSKIRELMNSDDIKCIYNFFDELSSQGNQRMISKACEEGLWEIVPFKNSVLGNQRNILHIACKKRNLNLVKSLIENGCDEDIEDDHECSPLIYASIEGHLEVVKYLISVGADKKTKNKDGNTPLICASSYGHLEVVKYLISVGADKEVKNNEEETPLICASEYGHLEVVKYLISVGADKEAKDDDGWTPLLCASEEGHLEVVQYLISVGADKEAKDDYRYTPLIKASKYGHLEVVQYLISVGADKDAKTNDGKTALSLASGDISEFLISIGV